MLDDILTYLARRFQEPSTYNALALLSTGLGFKIAPQYWDTIAFFCMMGFGAVGFALAERKKTTAVEIKSVVEAVVKPTALDPQPPKPQELEKVMRNGNGH